MKAKSRHVLWAGVEFQPDLKNPIKPVRLGAALYELGPSGWRSFVVIGRVPLQDPRPAEFEGASPMIMSLAANWVDAMVKDIMEADTADPLAHLASRWRWNLYVIDPAKLKVARGSLVMDAKRLYARFVGEPFRDASTPKARQPRVRQRAAAYPQSESQAIVIPPAWQVEQITRTVSTSADA